MTAAAYASRAALYAVELQGAQEPVTLAGLLHPGARVCEAPSGTGHFVARYVDAGCTTTLLDIEPGMIRHAAARYAGVAAVRGAVLALGTDPAPARFDLVVCPNTAANHLFATIGPRATTAALAELLDPGGALLVQLLVDHAPDPEPDRAPCFAPEGPFGEWIEEWTRYDAGGREVRRRRLQERLAPGTVRLHQRLSVDGEEYARTLVDLDVPSIDRVRGLADEAGLRVAEVARPGGMTELILRPAGAPTGGGR